MKAENIHSAKHTDDGKAGRGQALVEMTLLLPALFLLFAGLIELGFAFYNYLVVVNAAREGSRYGAKMPDYTDDDVSAVTVLAAKYLPDFVLEGSGAINPERASVIITRLNAPIPDSGEDYTYFIQSQQAFGKAALAEEDQVPPLHRSQITTERLDTIADEVRDALSGITFQQDAQFIAVETIYDHGQVIGLFHIGDIIPDPVAVRSLTIMRVIASARQQGCPIYPVAIHWSTVAGKQTGDSLGDIYNGTGEGNFGWLRWCSEASCGNANYLVAALYNPYLSLRDYDNPDEATDHRLNVDDDIWGNSGLSDSGDARAALDALVGEEIRVAVWDTATGTGINAEYHLARYAKIRIDSYHLPGQNRITATFLGFDDYCND
ncbi:MAG: TadE family protein [Chloroflexota bacterium]